MVFEDGHRLGPSAARPPRPGVDGQRAGAAGARVRPGIPDRRPRLRQLHGPGRRHRRGPLPGGATARAAPSARERCSRRPAVREPQRRRPRVRPRRPAVHRLRRRRHAGDPATARRTRDVPAGQAAAARRRPTGARRRSTRWACATPGGSASTGSTGDLWIGDVGQGAWEEIDRLPAGTPAGRQLRLEPLRGRRALQRRRRRRRRPGSCDPVAKYSHELGCTITGGYVYRGPCDPAARRRATCSATTAAAGCGRSPPAAGRGCWRSRARADVVRRGSGGELYAVSTAGPLLPLRHRLRPR